jgi:probable HAF family extracellular repeat protein
LKSKTLCITALTLLTALAIPVRLAAQDNQDHKHKHHHYKLIDMGTFGGPNSGFQESFLDFFMSGAPVQVLSNQGTAIANAETSTPDPLCFFGDCFYPNALERLDGKVSNLGTLPDGQRSGTYWISGNSLIAGTSDNGQIDPLLGFPETHAVIWRNGGITDLGTLGGGHESWGLAVNDEGDVVGFSQNTIPDPYAIFGPCTGSQVCTQTRAFLWHKGVMHDLGTLGGSDAIASLVNDRGQIAGVSYTGTDPSTNCNVLFNNSVLITHPFYWDKKNGMVDIGTLGGTCAGPNAINKRGQVVGDSNLAGDSSFHGFTWDHGVLSDVGTLGGNYSGAVWLNDAGDVIGFSTTPGDQYVHGYLRRHDVMIDLGTLPGENCGNVWGINASEQIVGGSLDCQTLQNGSGHASLWENGGPMVDLNTLFASGSDLTVTYAFFINDRGEIAAQGSLSNGDRHAVVLMPCDENHPGVEGCDDSMVEASDIASRPSPAVSDAASRPLPQSLMRRMSRFRFPGPALGPRN